jgi:flagellar P-ring protein precursor FlgI
MKSCFSRQSKLFLITVSLLLAGVWVAESYAVSRIKDIAHIDGLKKEMVIGYGLVVGLNGTGDGRKSTFTMQSIESMLERFGVTVDAAILKVNNVAAVMVTGEISPFMRVGSTIDVTVNSMGDATSLEGGTLLATPLIGVDGGLYAIAQGTATIGGFNASGGAGNSVSQNHTTAGQVISGGVVQRSLEPQYIADGQFDLTVFNMDFYTVTSMVEAINDRFGSAVAEGLDGRTVHVQIPVANRADPVGFIAELERLTVEVDTPARVVINEKTGTVVVGGAVQVGEAAVAHGNLTVEIRTQYNVSQGAPWGRGETVVTPDVETRVNEEQARIFALAESSTVATIADALNEIGASPRDIIAIFQALRRAGALRAELVVI